MGAEGRGRTMGGRCGVGMTKAHIVAYPSGPRAVDPRAITLATGPAPPRGWRTMTVVGCLASAVGRAVRWDVGAGT